jgi:ribosomal-protein-alanine acetyltransferase
MSEGVGEIRVRPMAVADLDRVIAIAASLREAPQWTRIAYESALASEAQPERIALTAESETSSPVGFAIAVVIPPQAELEIIAVAFEAQRQGVARQLFCALTAELKTRRVTEVLLEVRPSNLAAMSFYRVLGFKQTGARPRYYTEPEEDAVLMSLSLV